MTAFSPDTASEDDVAEQARSVAPVIWLLGKVQAGKSSIIRGLTGATKVAIGGGFRPCTQTADVYELPPEAPLIRFLDTRGLGETAYDPADDLAIAEQTSHCTIAVMRAMDRQQDVVLDALARVRKRHPAWPILVAQTHLHEGYARGAVHPDPYPFDHRTGEPLPAAPLPDDLTRSLAHQRARVAKLPGTGPLGFVPLDFTLPGDGYTPELYGLEALHEQLALIGPSALNAALEDTAAGAADPAAASGVHSLIVGHAAAASAADLIPVAALAAVPAVQARLLHALGRHHGLAWNRRTAIEFAGALGAGFLARYAAGFGIRQLTKLIPVYGQTAGAAAAAATSFATTYALGKAAHYFLDQRRRGRRDNAAVQKVWADALREAFDLAKMRGIAAAETSKP